MNRSSPRSCLIMLMVCFFLPAKIFAWNALGHMVVAQIAYQQLNSTTKAKVDSLITYFAKEYPSNASFVQMAVWPDAIRSQKIETFSRWHFIDVPFSADNTPLADTISTDNAEWAVNTIKPILGSTSANNYERARFLAFTIHIVGDLHQPLHAVTRISAAHRDGDRGGNLFNVVVKSSRTNLHALWDGGVGAVTSGDAKRIAQDIMSRYPASSLPAATNLNVKTWESEGMTTAKSTVYNIRENEQASTSYMTAGKNASEKALALAGYRLANLLNSSLK